MHDAVCHTVRFHHSSPPLEPEHTGVEQRSYSSLTVSAAVVVEATHIWPTNQTITNKVCTVTVDDCSTYERDNKRQLLRQKYVRRKMRNVMRSKINIQATRQILLSASEALGDEGRP